MAWADAEPPFVSRPPRSSDWTDDPPHTSRCEVCDAPATVRITFPRVDRVWLVCDQHAAEVDALAEELADE